DWFMNYYSDTIHEVVSGVCIRLPDGNIQMAECSTTVKFKVISHKLLDWYLSTEEPLGKAGGYGIQSAGSIFVESIHGSLSNVIGLPLELIVDEF
ncbi:Maf family protein, partial [bacterium]|nr:Maf family protein [bacterium]